MKAITRVFRYEFSRQGRRKGFLFVTIGIPLIALAIFYGIRLYQQYRETQQQPAQTGQAQSPFGDISADSPLRDIRPTGYVDQSGLLQGLKNTPLMIAYPDEAAAQAAMREGKIASYYLVAPDYLQSGKIEMYFEHFNLGNISNATFSRMILQGLLKEKAVEPNIITRLQARKLAVNNNLVSDGGDAKKTNQDASMVLIYVFALVLMFSTFTTSGYLMQSVVEEKESRMVEVLLSSLRPRDLLAGKFLALSLLGLIQMFFWGATVLFILGQLGTLSPELINVKVTNSQVAVIAIYFVLGYLLFGAAYAALGALATNMREGPQLAVVVTLPAAVPLYALTVFATTPNGPLAVGLSIFPLTAPLSMVMRAALIEVPIGELLISIALLTLTVILTIWLAGRLFRVNTLLSGQLPKLKDIVRLVRETV